MDELLNLAGIGLPGWFVIIAAIVFIMERVGLFNFAWKHIRDRREFEQQQREAENAARQSEQVALWSQMAQLQTKALDQNELLLEFVIDQNRERLEKHDQHMADCLKDIAENWKLANVEIRQLQTKIGIMVGIMEQDHE
jgi:biopolymer transport protein ExbB/TolQ